MEIQGCLVGPDRSHVHLPSLGTPTPPFPLELLFSFSLTPQTLNSNQLRWRLDLKAYPLEFGNRERAPLLTWHSSSIEDSFWSRRTGKAGVGGAIVPEDPTCKTNPYQSLDWVPESGAEPQDRVGCFAPQLAQKVAEAGSWVPQLGQNFMPGCGADP